MSVKKYDILLAGSDQIWHPSNRPLHYYTLDFISNIKKISYASSFGVNKLPNQMKRGYKKAFRRLIILLLENRVELILLVDWDYLHIWLSIQRYYFLVKNGTL